ncbi:hypothetical protein [Methylocella sp.]|uniref:hypothetical protein n=1 Tax=Methylocella sp. TaxID=1978226 RepID=UPI0037832129
MAVEWPTSPERNLAQRASGGVDVEAERRGGVGLFGEHDEADAVASAAASRADMLQGVDPARLRPVDLEILRRHAARKVERGNA